MLTSMDEPWRWSIRKLIVLISVAAGVMMLWRISTLLGLFSSLGLLLVCLSWRLDPVTAFPLRWGFFLSAVYFNSFWFGANALERAGREADLWLLAALPGLPFYVVLGIYWANLPRRRPDRLRARLFVVVLFATTYLVNITDAAYWFMRFSMGEKS